MPILSAAGGAASKGFGQFAKQGGGGYKNVMLGSQVYSTGAQLTTIYKSDINPYQGVTNFPTSPGSSYYSRNPGVITDGSFIAIAGGAYSIDNGASWSSWSGTSTSSTANNSPSLNGNIAYNPTAKRAAYFAPVTSSKTGTISYSIRTVSSSGVTTGTGNYGLDYSAGPLSMKYSPALDTFFLTGIGSSKTGVLIADGTTGAYISFTSGPQPGNFKGGISSDGYPMLAAYSGGGTTYYLYKYTNQSLTTYTNLGTISGAFANYSTQTPIIWCPVNNKYFVAAGYSGATITIGAGTSPQNLQTVGTITVPGYIQYILNLGMHIDASGVLWLTGFGQYSYKGVYYNNTPTFFSTNGGVSWSNSGYNWSAVTENFSL